MGTAVPPTVAVPDAIWQALEGVAAARHLPPLMLASASSPGGSFTVTSLTESPVPGWKLRFMPSLVPEPAAVLSPVPFCVSVSVGMMLADALAASAADAATARATTRRTDLPRRT